MNRRILLLLLLLLLPISAKSGDDQRFLDNVLHSERDPQYLLTTLTFKPAVVKQTLGLTDVQLSQLQAVAAADAKRVRAELDDWYVERTWKTADAFRQEWADRIRSDIEQVEQILTPAQIAKLHDWTFRQATTD